MYLRNVASVVGTTALTYETLTWDAPVEAGYGLADLRAAQRQAGKYDAAIPASIAELAVTLPAAALADAEEASNEITRFDAELGDEIAPFRRSCCDPNRQRAPTSRI